MHSSLILWNLVYNHSFFDINCLRVSAIGSHRVGIEVGRQCDCTRSSPVFRRPLSIADDSVTKQNQWELVDFFSRHSRWSSDDPTSMSVLILSLDVSSDRIGFQLHQLLNSAFSSTHPHVASFCSSVRLFASTCDDFERVLHESLKTDCLSHNDLLGFLVLIDVATTGKLHLDHLSSIRSLLTYLSHKHPFQSILTFIVHAHAHNRLYTSALTCFNVNLLLQCIYPLVHGLVFHSIDQITDDQTYHVTVARQIASIFRPVSSLREEKNRRTNRSVCTEFLQFSQHLLSDPSRKLLIMIDKNWKSYLRSSSRATLLIQRGKPSSRVDGIPWKNVDVWNSLESHSDSILIVNNDELNRDLLSALVIEPCRRKLTAHNAYLYWLQKKFDLNDIEVQLNRGNRFCEEILEHE